jgi:hypothetical protein
MPCERSNSANSLISCLLPFNPWISKTPITGCRLAGAGWFGNFSGDMSDILMRLILVRAFCIDIFYQAYTLQRFDEPKGFLFKLYNILRFRVPERS